MAIPLGVYVVSQLGEACNANEGDDPGGWEGNKSSADYPCDPKANDSDSSETRYGVSIGIVEGAPLHRSDGECFSLG